MFEFFLELQCHYRSLRLVPHFGLVVQQNKTSSPATPVPQPHFHERFPIMGALQLTDMQQVTCTISAVDKKGNPAPLPAGTVTWSVNSPSVVAVTAAPDGLSANLVAGGLGTATVSVIVADTSGTTIAAGSLDVTVTGGPAASIVITPGTPTNQP